MPIQVVQASYLYQQENNQKKKQSIHKTQSGRAEKQEKSSGREGAHWNYATEDKPKSRELGNSTTQELSDISSISNSARQDILAYEPHKNTRQDNGYRFNSCLVHFTQHAQPPWCSHRYTLGARVPGFQWEHAEYIAGFETLCPTSAQQEHSVHIQNVISICTPNVPIGNISFTADMRPCHVSKMYPPRTF